MINVATIGTNFIVDWFISAVQTIPSLHYHTVYSRNPETALAFKEKHGAQAIETDLLALAQNPEINGVYIASPNSCHYEQALLMLSHGKHVLCEKTITTNAAQLARLITLAEEQHLVLMEGMRALFTPGFQKMTAALPRLGTIRRVSFQYCQYSSRYDHFKKGIVENAFNPALSNGALMDIGVYCIHPLVKLFGVPQKIVAEGIRLKNGVDGAGTILATYDGMDAELTYSKITDGHIPSQIQGEDGTLLLTAINRPLELKLFPRQGSPESLFSATPGKGRDLDMVGQVTEWVRLIEAGHTGACHNQYSLMSLEIMDEARRQIGLIFPDDDHSFQRL